MTLSLYIARRFLGSFLRVFLASFLGILLLIDMIEQLRRFSDADIGLAGAAHLAVLNVPETMYRILPLIIVMGAISNVPGAGAVVGTGGGAGGGAVGLAVPGDAPVVTALAIGLVGGGGVQPAWWRRPQRPMTAHAARAADPWGRHARFCRVGRGALAAAGDRARGRR
jgi:hypothetical protein